MTTLHEARSIILGAVSRLPSETVQLIDSCGRVLSEQVCAPWDLPLVDNTAMDGYAVRSCDCLPSASIRVAGYTPAGGGQERVSAGEAVRIMTGAPIPAGADAVELSREEWYTLLLAARGEPLP